MKKFNKIHCLFEQSGTFKNEFIKMGIPAEDYDIENNFDETDHIIDLFSEIEKAYDNKPSIFDNISNNDLVMAFFPCIYFCDANVLFFNGTSVSYNGLTKKEISDKIIERSIIRNNFYIAILKLFTIADTRGLHLIVENPYSYSHFLVNNFPYRASYIDLDRTCTGDFYKKPTQYWFVNLQPTHGSSFIKTPKNKIRKINNTQSSKHKGLCSIARSKISSIYAHIFICDHILGINSNYTQPSLF